MNMLYVEDDAVGADVLIRMFSSIAPQIRVEWTSTLAGAIQKLGQSTPKHPVYDIILTDMELPDGNGISLLQVLREHGLRIPLVVITGIGSEETVVAALKSGASDYVVKRGDYFSTLPAVLEAAKDRYQSSAAAFLKHLRVLYAEPNTNDIDLTKRHFAVAAPYVHMDVVSSAEEAFERLRDQAKGEGDAELKYNVLLFEYYLPDMNGIEVIKELRETLKIDIPIVFLTSQGSENSALQSLRLGASDYVVKGKGYLNQLPFILESAFNKAQAEREHRALKISEEKYRGIFDNAVEGILLTAPAEGKIMAANPAACQMFRRTEEELRQIGRAGTADPSDPRLAEAIEERKHTGTFRSEHFHIRKDGSRFLCEVISNVFKDADGQTRASVILRDITEQRQAEKLLKESYEKLKKALAATVNAMATTVEARDPYTAGHQKRVAMLAAAITEKMDLPVDAVDGVRMAGSIHDIGKIAVPAEILSKPTRLSSLEFSIIKVHPEVGYDILKEIEFPWPVAQIIYQHHERLDGMGYPRGLKGDSILLGARIIAVADVVEAIASHRPYRPAQGIDEALDEIVKNKSVLYDARVVDACISVFKEDGFAFE